MSNLLEMCKTLELEAYDRGFQEGLDCGKLAKLEEFAMNVLEHLADIRWSIEESVRGIELGRIPAHAVLEDLTDLGRTIGKLQGKYLADAV